MITFDARRLARSFSNAARGILLVFKEEQSFRIQVFAGAGVIGELGTGLRNHG